MRTTARSAPAIVLVLAIALLLTGCPKRPVTIGASAPPPTAPSGTPTPAPTPPTVVPSPTPAPAARPTQFEENANLKDVYFDFDKSDIRPQDAKTLDANAAWLKTRGNDLVLIEGHCDERGTNEYNLALGEDCRPPASPSSPTARSGPSAQSTPRAAGRRTVARTSSSRPSSPSPVPTAVWPPR